MSTPVLAVVSIFWVVCAISASVIADRKGLSGGGFFLLGLLLGLIGVAIALIAQPRHAAGWYPDPWHAAELRYFDGQGWTGHVGGEPLPH